MRIDTSISNYTTFAALILPCHLYVAMDVKKYNHHPSDVLQEPLPFLPLTNSHSIAVQTPTNCSVVTHCLCDCA